VSLVTPVFRQSVGRIQRHAPTHAVVTLDDMAVWLFEDKEQLKRSIECCEATMRPFISFELRERGHSAPTRKVWHPCETRFFDPRNGK